MFPMMRTLATVTSALLLAGCATVPDNLLLAPDHPANPDAAASPVPSSSQTLALGVQSSSPIIAAAPDHGQGGDMKPGTNEAANTPHHGAHDHAGSVAPATNAHGRPTPSGETVAAFATDSASVQVPTAPVGAAFVCPMHPKVVSNEPNAKCPTCGMKINKPNPAAAAPTTMPAFGAAAAPAAYICPMHPAVVSADPNAPCPTCGMKINKRNPAVAGPAGTTRPAAPVPSPAHSGHGGHEGGHR